MEKSQISSLDQNWVSRVSAGDALFDWNKLAIDSKHRVKEADIKQLTKVKFRSEDFRDALGVALRIPSERDKRYFIEDLTALGVDMITVDIFSSASVEKLNRSNKTSLKIISWMKKNCPDVRPVILARSMHPDIEYVKMAYDLNPKVIAIIFQDLSEVRRLVEGWGDFDSVLSNLVDHIKIAKDYGVDVMAFTENLSITNPEDVYKYVTESCRAGADWIGIADTAGRLLPVGASYITEFVADAIKDFQKENKQTKEVGIVFHGHDDLGNAVNNSLASLSSGASVLDVVVNGLGERVGNTNLIELAANCEYRLRLNSKDHEFSRFNLSLLKPLSERFSRMTATENRNAQPIVSDSVFSTHFGIHANYYYKVEILSLYMLEEGYSLDEVVSFKTEAWKVYSAVSPSDCDVVPDIRISPFSGASNVILRLKHLKLIDDIRHYPKTSFKVKEILKQAKRGWGELHDDEVIRIWNELG